MKANEPMRMWINQPSTLQPLHALHGTNVLAQHEHDDTMRIFFLSGEIISQQASRLALSPGWLPATPADVGTKQKQVVEVVTGLHKALSRMIDKHNPDSIEAEWLGHSNELIRELTGKDIR